MDAVDDSVARLANGDARAALGALEASADLARDTSAKTITLAIAEQGVQRKALLYDKGGEEHYNVISAFIKSMRGSDPDAAVYWLARMLEAGERLSRHIGELRQQQQALDPRAGRQLERQPVQRLLRRSEQAMRVGIRGVERGAQCRRDFVQQRERLVVRHPA